MRKNQAQELGHTAHEAQIEIVPRVQLGQVGQLFEELDDCFISGVSIGSHARRLSSLGSVGA